MKHLSLIAALVATLAVPVLAQAPVKGTKAPTTVKRTSRATVLAAPRDMPPNPILEALKVQRAKYPLLMTRAQAAELLNAVAWAYRPACPGCPGWGLLKKGSGNSCPLGAVFVSCDILIRYDGPKDENSEHFDVATGADFENVSANLTAMTFNSDGPCVPGPSSGCSIANFLAPIAPAGATDTPPPPVVGPGTGTSTGTGATTDTSALASFIEDVRASLGRIEARQQDEANAHAATQAQLDTLIARPLPSIVFPPYKGNIFGASVTLRPQ